MSPVVFFVIIMLSVFSLIAALVFSGHERLIFREACIKDGHSIQECERLFQ